MKTTQQTKGDQTLACHARIRLLACTYLGPELQPAHPQYIRTLPLIAHTLNKSNIILILVEIEFQLVIGHSGNADRKTRAIVP